MKILVLNVAKLSCGEACKFGYERMTSHSAIRNVGNDGQIVRHNTNHQ